MNRDQCDKKDATVALWLFCCSIGLTQKQQSWSKVVKTTTHSHTTGSATSWTKRQDHHDVLSWLLFDRLLLIIAMALDSLADCSFGFRSSGTAVHLAVEDFPPVCWCQSLVRSVWLWRDLGYQRLFVLLWGSSRTRRKHSLWFRWEDECAFALSWARPIRQNNTKQPAIDRQST